MNVYVGNLSNDATESDLRDKFEAYGDVSSVTIMTDRISGNPLGFGFVEMPDDDAAGEAITGLKRTTIRDRVVMVAETNSRVERRKQSVPVAHASA